MKDLLLKLKFRKKATKLQKKISKQEKQIKKLLQILDEIEPKGKEFTINK